MDEINRKRLEWVAAAGLGASFDEGLFGPIDKIGNGWGPALSEAAQAALDEIAEKDRILATLAIHGPQVAWRPIAEAPIPPVDDLPEYWIYRCLIQDDDRNVYAGFARYVNVNARGNSPRVLRWYEGVSQRYAQILKPRYFQPLPQPRKD